jgi:NTP pyrophosphatase (non-canonical NTP hydrolase)
MVYSFSKDQNLREFQAMIGDIYGLPDDQLFSLWDLLSQKQRFSMRALKGIRKQDKDQIRLNLLIALSWLMAIANRLHIDLSDEVWKEFPNACSYCGKRPCECRKAKTPNRKQIKGDERHRPKSLRAMQEMFENIYPSKERSLPDAGIHFAEETGEVSEAIHNYLGQHRKKLFSEIELEMADYVSCAFGVANSAGIDMAKELEKMFYENCHVCHKAPCTCSFAAITEI